MQHPIAFKSLRNAPNSAVSYSYLNLNQDKAQVTKCSNYLSDVLSGEAHKAKTEATLSRSEVKQL